MTTEPLVVAPLAALRDVPHAIPYQGSKRQLAHAIVRLLPADTDTLVEPFAGSAAISIAARYAGRARAVALNDINEPLMRLWGEILREPAELADRYEALWTDQLADPRSYYDDVRRTFNATGEPHLLLYLLARCVKAAVRYSRAGEFNQSPDNRRLGAKPVRMRERLVRTSRTLAGATVTATDYAERLLGAAPADVVYMDPPYQGVSNVRDHRYVRGLGREDFEDVLRRAVTDRVSFIISYDAVTADERYGKALSDGLGLTHVHVFAGRSSQATLQGIVHSTVESLYLSPALLDRLGDLSALASTTQLPLAARR